MLEQTIVLVAVMANLATALRLICYQRQGARYRLGMSLLAYALIVCTGGYAIDVVINHAPASPWVAGISLILAVLVFRARGNVAAVVRIEA